MVARVENIKMTIDSDGRPIKATVVIQTEGEFLEEDVIDPVHLATTRNIVFFAV